MNRVRCETHLSVKRHFFLWLLITGAENSSDMAHNQNHITWIDSYITMSGNVVSSMLKSPGISLIEKSNPQKQIITMLKLVPRATLLVLCRLRGKNFGIFYHAMRKRWNLSHARWDDTGHWKTHGNSKTQKTQKTGILKFYEIFQCLVQSHPEWVHTWCDLKNHQCDCSLFDIYVILLTKH